MTLGDFELIPGVIIDAEDDKHLGRVKCGCMNDFDSTCMDPEMFVWCKPFMSSGYQRYSKMQPKQQVWILKDTQNLDVYWFIPRYDMTGDAQDIINEQDADNVEINHLRQVNGGTMIQKSDDKTGYVTQTPTSTVTVGNDDKIVLSTQDATVDVNNGQITLEAGDEKPQYMLRGDEILNLLRDISKKMERISSICSQSWGLWSLQLPFHELSTSISDAVDSGNLQSKTVKNG